MRKREEIEQHFKLESWRQFYSPQVISLQNHNSTNDWTRDAESINSFEENNRHFKFSPFLILENYIYKYLEGSYYGVYFKRRAKNRSDQTLISVSQWYSFII